MNPQTAILAALALPLLSTVLTALFGKRPNVREASTLIHGVALFVVVASLVPEVLAGQRPAVALFEVMPGLALAFELEPLGLLFALVASGLWIVTSTYSIGYMRGHNESNQTRYYAFFAVAIGAFTTHALRSRIAPEDLELIRLGSRYQMFHALALLWTALAGRWWTRW